jgi:fido (protein-threonine AMPylation protein)
MKNSILGALRQELLTRCPITALPNPLWRRVAIIDTWGSNAIEGNALTLCEVESILLEGKSPGGRSVRDVLETVQHARAFEGLLGMMDDPISTGTTLELHSVVFRGVLGDAGRWRNREVAISGVLHRPPHHEWLPAMMKDWEVVVAETETVGGDVLARAARVHHRFEAIHPFSDGNGRVGRLLLNLFLLRRSWPPIHILPCDRRAYLDAMDIGHTGDMTPLVDLLGVLAGRSLLDLLDQLGGPKDEMRSISSLAEDGPYGAKYLALRAMQGVLPAVKTKNAWHTSARAIDLYREAQGRKRAATPALAIARAGNDIRTQRDDRIRKENGR